jgi:hypothetical protein
MPNYVILISLDQTFMESAFIKRGNTVIEAFDVMGKLWPLHEGKTYQVELELRQVDTQDPAAINKTKPELQKIDDTYKCHLYGYAEKNIFYIVNLILLLKEYNDYGQYNNKQIPFTANRINVELLQKAPDQNNHYNMSTLFQTHIQTHNYAAFCGRGVMRTHVTLISLDQSFEESRFIKRGNTVIEAFDYMGKLWPLYEGKTYQVELELEQLDPQEPEIIHKTEPKLQKIDDTYEYHLYGYVEENIFYVGEFKFDFKEYNDYGKYNNKYIKFIVDRINVEFLQEVTDQNNH